MTGFIGAAGGLGGFLMPSLLGLLKGMTGTYAAGFLTLAFAGISCLLMLIGQKRRWADELLAETPVPDPSLAGSLRS